MKTYSLEQLKSKFKELVENTVKIVGVVEDGDFEVWLLDNDNFIRLKKGYERINIYEVLAIAEIKLGISTWELDAWLG